MATEFGLFNDEGIVEGGFYSVGEARAAIYSRYSQEDGLEIEEVCPDHCDHARNGCEECDAEEQAEELEDEEAEEDDE